MTLRARKRTSPSTCLVPKVLLQDILNHVDALAICVDEEWGLRPEWKEWVLRLHDTILELTGETKPP